MLSDCGCVELCAFACTHTDTHTHTHTHTHTNTLTHIQLTTVCFINSSLKTQPESDCRQELTNFLDKFKSARLSSPSTNTPNVLSHVPLDNLQSTTNIKTKILSSLRPNFVFSGHIHHEKYTIHSTVPEGRRNSLPNDKKLEGFTHEITVPTCSYCMGQRQMGVGAAVVGEF